MDEVSNLNKEEVKAIIEKGFPFKPLKNKIIITVNTDEYEDELQLVTNQMSEYQYVVATSGRSFDINAGDKVLLNLENMMEYDAIQTNSDEKKGRIKITPITVGDRMYALVSDGVIDAIDESTE